MKAIFIVEDETDMLDLMTSALSSLGYKVATANRCAGALQKIKKCAPEVVVLDVMLPDGAGYQVSRAIRADTILYKTPILYMSAMGEQPEIEHALKQGGDAYLVKPFSLKDLVAQFQQMELLTRKIEGRCPLTGLHGLEAVKREMDHRLFRNQPFSLCYLHVDYSCSLMFNENRMTTNEMASRLAELLKRTIRGKNLYETFLAHAGEAHFFVLMNHGVLLDHPVFINFCQSVQDNFNHEVLSLYDERGRHGRVGVSMTNTHAGEKTMSLKIHMMTSENSGFINADEMLQQFKNIARQG